MPPINPMCIAMYPFEYWLREVLAEPGWLQTSSDPTDKGRLKVGRGLRSGLCAPRGGVRCQPSPPQLSWPTCKAVFSARHRMGPAGDLQYADSMNRKLGAPRTTCVARVAESASHVALRLISLTWAESACEAAVDPPRPLFPVERARRRRSDLVRCHPSSIRVGFGDADVLGRFLLVSSLWPSTR